MSRTVTCKNGHKHRISDLDKFGEDYKCPECFTKIYPRR